MEISASTSAAMTRPGKSAQSVGHMAKAAVAEARAAGIDLPRNAQGKAASAIAQGADPASIFAARVQPEPAPDVPSTGTELGGETVAASDPAASDGTATASPAPGTADDPVSSAYSTAVDIIAPILTPEEDQRLSLMI